MPDLGSTRWRHIALGDVGSTNDHIADLARAGDAGDLWVTAKRQLSGKGRRGRRWISEAGNLYASLLLLNAAPIAKFSTMPLLAALALHDAISQVLPSMDGLSIKWPNDLLLNSQKCAGILLENQKIGDNWALIIGFGINLAHAPTDTPYPAQSFLEAGWHIAPEVLFDHLQASVAARLGQWRQGEGAAQIVDAWRSRASGLGEAITVNLSDQSLHGRFVDIDATGQLLLQMPDNRTIPIATGDVFFNNPQTPKGTT